MSIIQFQTRKPEPNKLDSLMEVLPYIKLYSGEAFVVYCDGEVLNNDELLKAFAQDVVLLKGMGINIFVVHGGDYYVNRTLKKFNIAPEYVDEMRVIDQESIEVVEMVLSGLLNKKIVSKINDAGGMAFGISGKDCNLIEAKKFRSSQSTPGSNVKSIIDFGFVGEPTSVNPEILLMFEESDLIPVISPIAIGENAETFYINPITVSGVIASALSVCKYVILSDYPGIVEKDGNVIANMEEYQLLQMAKSKIEPKDLEHIIHTCICVLENGADAVHIINGRTPHALLLEVFSEGGLGTCIECSED